MAKTGSSSSSQTAPQTDSIQTTATSSNTANSGSSSSSGSGSKSGSSSATKTSASQGSSKQTSSAAQITSVDPRLPAGGVNLLTPSAIAQATYYKIGDSVSFVWNYTSLEVTPSNVDILVTCTANSATYTLSSNASFASTGSVLWDTNADKTGTAPLLTETYTLVIHDASKDVTQVADAGHLGTYNQYTFGMYIPQNYTPRSGMFPPSFAAFFLGFTKPQSNRLDLCYLQQCFLRHRAPDTQIHVRHVYGYYPILHLVCWGVWWALLDLQRHRLMNCLNLSLDIFCTAGLGVTLHNARLVGLALWSSSSGRTWRLWSKIWCWHRGEESKSGNGYFGYQSLFYNFVYCIQHILSIFCCRISTKTLLLWLLFVTPLVYAFTSSGLSHWASMPVP